MDIGIDLGTTFSVVAVPGKIELCRDYGEGIYIDECDVTVIPSPFGEPSFPSVVIEDPQNPGNLLFGSAAVDAADENHAPIMFSKRGMGTSTSFITGSQLLSARDVATKFIAYMRECAELALGASVERAVITHPAYFDRIAVEHTRDAAISAGLDMGMPEQMLMEPVAAAIAYTRADKRERLNVLTYDLGGGTFDVTVLRRSDGVIEMKSFDGDHLLGGYNFDRELVNWLHKKLSTRGRSLALDMESEVGRAAVSNLLRIAEKVKIALAQEEDVDKMLEFRARGVAKDTEGKDLLVNERISRREFECLIGPYIDRTVECCKSALVKAHFAPSDIHELLLVGGSSQGPWIEEALKGLFSNSHLNLFKPDLAIAIGAAVHASMVLPKRVGVRDYNIQLEFPERSESEFVTITGFITLSSGGSLLNRALRLFNQESLEIARTDLDTGGRFFFRDVELQDLEKPNKFSLELPSNGHGVPPAHHSFVIVHESKSSDISTVTTVLPRPLLIETYDGLVPLVAEGAALPAKLKRTFVRINDNKNIELRIYQSGSVIGTIRVDNIPPDGGKGALVELEIEITQKNEVCGRALIRSKDGAKILTERPVAIRYDVIEVPGTEALTAEIQVLSTIIERIREGAEVARSEVAETSCAQAEELLCHARALLGQVPREPQEVFEALRKARALLEPSRDDMRPSQREFFELLRDCKDTCSSMIVSAQRMIGVEGASNDLDATLVRSCERDISVARGYEQKLVELESSGRRAMGQKDRRRWLQAYERMREIRGELMKDQKRTIAPTAANKLLARREVTSLLRDFHLAAARIEADGTIGDWKDQLCKIYQKLTDAIIEITNIDDDIDDGIALSKIRNLLFQRLAGVREDIISIGQVIRVLNR